jgi:hypothetical protein
MNSSKRIENEKKEREKSFRLFIGTSIGITLGGIVYGVRRQLKKEKFTFVYHEHRGSVFLAFKALVYGTLLTMGTFSAGILIANKVYNIDRIDDFITLIQEKVGPYIVKTPEFEKDAKAISGMTLDQEMDYWSKVVESTDNDNNNNQNDLEKSFAEDEIDRDNNINNDNDDSDAKSSRNKNS